MCPESICVNTLNTYMFLCACATVLIPLCVEIYQMNNEMKYERWPTYFAMSLHVALWKKSGTCKMQIEQYLYRCCPNPKHCWRIFKNGWQSLHICPPKNLTKPPSQISSKKNPFLPKKKAKPHPKKKPFLAKNPTKNLCVLINQNPNPYHKSLCTTQVFAHSCNPQKTA